LGSPSFHSFLIYYCSINFSRRKGRKTLSANILRFPKEKTQNPVRAAGFLPEAVRIFSEAATKNPKQELRVCFL